MSGATFDYLKALIVEDNVHMRTLLRSLLMALGLKQVFEAANGEDAFVIMRERKPDHIVHRPNAARVQPIELRRRRTDQDDLFAKLAQQGLFGQLAALCPAPRKIPAGFIGMANENDFVPLLQQGDDAETGRRQNRSCHH